eukprot:tig00020943_g16246.t1
MAAIRICSGATRPRRERAPRAAGVGALQLYVSGFALLLLVAAGSCLAEASRGASERGAGGRVHGKATERRSRHAPYGHGAAAHDLPRHSAADPSLHPRKIFLRGHTLDTASVPALGHHRSQKLARFGAGAGVGAGAGAPSAYYVHFGGPLDGQRWREAEACLGVPLSQYLPHHTFLVSLTPRAAERAACVPLAWISSEPSSPGPWPGCLHSPNLSAPALLYPPSPPLPFPFSPLPPPPPNPAPSSSPRPFADLACVAHVERDAELELAGYFASRLLQSGNDSSSPLYDRGLDGTGEVVGVLDASMEFDHCFFADDDWNPQTPGLFATLENTDGSRRKLVRRNFFVGGTAAISDPRHTRHGTAVAGLVAGCPSAASAAPQKELMAKHCGVARNAKIYFDGSLALVRGRQGRQVLGRQLFPEKLRESLQPAYEAGMRVQVHAWVGATGSAYDARASELDRFAWQNKEYLPVVAAGNARDRVSSPGTAKNVLSVAASMASARDLATSLPFTNAPSDWLSGPVNRATCEANGLPLGDPAIPCPGTAGCCAESMASVVVGSDPYFARWYGASDENDLWGFSAPGPTSDGRIRPNIAGIGSQLAAAFADGDLNSFQCGFSGPKYDPGILGGARPGLATFEGTSAAAATIGGAAALVRQYFREGWYPGGFKSSGSPFSPSGSLVRAVMLNSARPLTGFVRQRPGPPQRVNSSQPNFESGFGKPALTRALVFPDSARNMSYFEGNVTNADVGRTFQYTIRVSNPAEDLRITLCYADYPAFAGAAIAPVSDVDLSAVDPSGMIYFPNGLSSADRLNNDEQIVIPAAALQQDSVVTINVTVAAINSPPSEGPLLYSLVVTGGFLQEDAIALPAPPYAPTPPPLEFYVRALPQRPALRQPEPQVRRYLHRASEPVNAFGDTFFVRVAPPEGLSEDQIGAHRLALRCSEVGRECYELDLQYAAYQLSSLPREEFEGLNLYRIDPKFVGCWPAGVLRLDLVDAAGATVFRGENIDVVPRPVELIRIRMPPGLGPEGPPREPAGAARSLDGCPNDARQVCESRIRRVELVTGSVERGSFVFHTATPVEARWSTTSHPACPFLVAFVRPAASSPPSFGAALGDAITAVDGTASVLRNASEARVPQSGAVYASHRAQWLNQDVVFQFAVSFNPKIHGPHPDLEAFAAAQHADFLLRHNSPSNAGPVVSVPFKFAGPPSLAAEAEQYAQTVRRAIAAGDAEAASTTKPPCAAIAKGAAKVTARLQSCDRQDQLDCDEAEYKEKAGFTADYGDYAVCSWEGMPEEVFMNPRSFISLAPLEVLLGAVENGSVQSFPDYPAVFHEVVFSRRITTASGQARFPLRCLPAGRYGCAAFVQQSPPQAFWRAFLNLRHDIPACWQVENERLDRRLYNLCPDVLVDRAPAENGFIALDDMRTGYSVKTLFDPAQPEVVKCEVTMPARRCVNEEVGLQTLRFQDAFDKVINRVTTNGRMFAVVYPPQFVSAAALSRLLLGTETASTLARRPVLPAVNKQLVEFRVDAIARRLREERNGNVAPSALSFVVCNIASPGSISWDAGIRDLPRLSFYRHLPNPPAFDEAQMPSSASPGDYVVPIAPLAPIPAPPMLTGRHALQTGEETDSVGLELEDSDADAVAGFDAGIDYPPGTADVRGRTLEPGTFASLRIVWRDLFSDAVERRRTTELLVRGVHPSMFADAAECDPEYLQEGDACPAGPFSEEAHEAYMERVGAAGEAEEAGEGAGAGAPAVSVRFDERAGPDDDFVRLVIDWTKCLDVDGEEAPCAPAASGDLADGPYGRYRLFYSGWTDEDLFEATAEVHVVGPRDKEACEATYNDEDGMEGCLRNAACLVCRYETLPASEAQSNGLAVPVRGAYPAWGFCVTGDSTDPSAPSTAPGPYFNGTSSMTCDQIARTVESPHWVSLHALLAAEGRRKLHQEFEFSALEPESVIEEDSQAPEDAFVNAAVYPPLYSMINPITNELCYGDDAGTAVASSAAAQTACLESRGCGLCHAEDGSHSCLPSAVDGLSSADRSCTRERWTPPRLAFGNDTALGVYEDCPGYSTLSKCVAPIDGQLSSRERGSDCYVQYRPYPSLQACVSARLGAGDGLLVSLVKSPVSPADSAAAECALRSEDPGAPVDAAKCCADSGCTIPGCHAVAGSGCTAPAGAPPGGRRELRQAPAAPAPALRTAFDFACDACASALQMGVERTQDRPYAQDPVAQCSGLAPLAPGPAGSVLAAVFSNGTANATFTSKTARAGLASLFYLYASLTKGVALTDPKYAPCKSVSAVLLPASRAACLPFLEWADAYLRQLWPSACRDLVAAVVPELNAFNERALGRAARSLWLAAVNATTVPGYALHVQSACTNNVKSKADVVSGSGAVCRISPAVQSSALKAAAAVVSPRPLVRSALVDLSYALESADTCNVFVAKQDPPSVKGVIGEVLRKSSANQTDVDSQILVGRGRCFAQVGSGRVSISGAVLPEGASAVLATIRVTVQAGPKPSSPLPPAVAAVIRNSSVTLGGRGPVEVSLLDANGTVLAPPTVRRALNATGGAGLLEAAVPGFRGARRTVLPNGLVRLAATKIFAVVNVTDITMSFDVKPPARASGRGSEAIAAASQRKCRSIAAQLSPLLVQRRVVAAANARDGSMVPISDPVTGNATVSASCSGSTLILALSLWDNTNPFTALNARSVPAGGLVAGASAGSDDSSLRLLSALRSSAFLRSFRLQRLASPAIAVVNQRALRNVSASGVLDAPALGATDAASIARLAGAQQLAEAAAAFSALNRKPSESGFPVALNFAIRFANLTVSDYADIVDLHPPAYAAGQWADEIFALVFDLLKSGDACSKRQRCFRREQVHVSNFTAEACSEAPCAYTVAGTLQNRGRDARALHMARALLQADGPSAADGVGAIGEQCGAGAGCAIGGQDFEAGDLRTTSAAVYSQSLPELRSGATGAAPPGWPWIAIVAGLQMAVAAAFAGRLDH